MAIDDLDALNMSWRSAFLMAILVSICAVAMTHATRQIERRAGLLLAAFMCLYALNVTPQVLGFAGFYRVFPGLTFAPFTSELWLGPLLLQFTFTLLKQPRPKGLTYLYLPALVQSLYYCLAFIILPDYQAKWAYNDAIHIIYIRPLEIGLIMAVTAYCIAKSWKCIFRYRAQLEHIESNLEYFDSRWLTTFIALMTALLVLWSGLEIVIQITGLSYTSQYPIYLLLSLIVLWMGLQALSSIRYPFPEPLSIQTIESPNRDKQLEDLAKKIEHELWAGQWFLRSRFSISDMARAMASNETYISRAINKHLNTNYNGLINKARVEYAMQIIEGSPSTPLIEVGLQSGFNSKASFNRSFKQIAGSTPGEFQARYKS